MIILYNINKNYLKYIQITIINYKINYYKCVNNNYNKINYKILIKIININ